jgi:hypothetical protein
MSGFSNHKDVKLFTSGVFADLLVKQHQEEEEEEEEEDGESGEVEDQDDGIDEGYSE